MVADIFIAFFFLFGGSKPYIFIQNISPKIRCPKKASTSFFICLKNRKIKKCDVQLFF